MPQQEIDGTAYTAVPTADGLQVLAFPSFEALKEKQKQHPTLPILAVNGPEITAAKSQNNILYTDPCMVPEFAMVDVKYSTCKSQHTYQATGRRINIFDSKEAKLAEPKYRECGVYVYNTKKPCPWCPATTLYGLEGIDTPEVTVGRLAKHLGYSVGHICGLIRKGKLPSGRKQAGKRWLAVTEVKEALDKLQPGKDLRPRKKLRAQFSDLADLI